MTRYTCQCRYQLTSRVSYDLHGHKSEHKIPIMIRAIHKRFMLVMARFKAWNDSACDLPR